MAVVSDVRRRDDEHRLFVRWRRHGDLRAREKLIERYLPLARKLARRYAGREPFDDLAQVASVGLVSAIDRFDPELGTAFSSFAVPTILGELKRYFRDCGWFVHVARRTQERALAVKEARRKLIASTGLPPSIEELAQYLELRSEDVLEALEAAEGQRARSLDAPAAGGDRDGEVRTLAETLGDEESGFDRVDTAMTLAAAASVLSDEERQLLALRFDQELTQKEIASRLGTSQMHVSRLLRRTFDRLREAIDPAGPELR